MEGMVPRSSAGSFNAVLPLMVVVFAHSEFLSTEVLQAPEWVEELPASGDLHRVIGRATVPLRDVVAAALSR